MLGLHFETRAFHLMQVIHLTCFATTRQAEHKHVAYFEPLTWPEIVAGNFLITRRLERIVKKMVRRGRLVVLVLHAANVTTSCSEALASPGQVQQDKSSCT